MNNKFIKTALKGAMTLVVGSLVVACTGDFESINKNPLNPDAHQKTLDGVDLGGYFPDYQKRVIPTRGPGEGTDRPNEYQVMLNLASDNWVGYFSPMVNKFNNGNNFTTYYMIEGWVNYSYSTAFNNIVNTWMQIRDLTHTKEQGADGKVVYKEKNLLNQSIYSIAQIIKVQAMSRATDIFGPLPYSKLGQGELLVGYDSQEDIYKSFFKELETAINTLTAYANTSDKIIENFDGVYHGDVKKWIKYGNSLMLRLAMRVRYADQNLAREYAQKAVLNPGGLIEKTDEIAQLKNSARFKYMNSIKLLWDEYSDLRMGATIYSYLKGYNDPRLAVYFRKGKNGTTSDYYAVRTGVPQGSKADEYKDFSVPNIVDDTPTYWMKASEVFFLRSEAALVGLTSGDAKALYNQGIAKSFEENGLQVGNYVTASGTPAPYVDPIHSNYNADAPSRISKNWDNATTEEEHLEQIITQKYIAIFPDGQESWSEWRRTGYPRQITVYENRTNSSVADSDGHKYGMRRMPFPQSEKRQNAANVTAATQLLGGADNAATRLWWDKNPALN